jgi:hypothetical protein
MIDLTDKMEYCLRRSLLSLLVGAISTRPFFSPLP